jgi:ABC-2 type transport system permease protein
MPLFMLILFLVQMIGAEVNEEKTTKSMEIIISNVSPKTHFLSKVLSSNLFVIIQGGLLIIFVLLGIGIRYFLTSGDLLGGLGSEVTGFVEGLSLNGAAETLSLMLPILLVMIMLTFVAYSLLAGILASMTTNLEDFQQLQTPIVIISLIGYYLSMMASMFSGSVFIKIMSYIPFISSMLSPTLYVMGEIGVIDLVISIGLLLGTIYILIKYGLRIYKVGILNYSQSGLWKKMFKAMKE